MPAPVTFTLDLEDLRTSPDQEARVDLVTDRLLDRLAELDVRGTVFCVADLAHDHARLLRRVAADGHEVAVHGLHHIPLQDLGPERFRSEAAEAKALLEDLVGVEVAGFRAPQFSLVRDSAWAPDILGELGYAYSSSILPASNPLYGWPGAPRVPFRWPCGLVELPCPVVTLGAWEFPFLGGAYLRVLPQAFRRRGLRATDPGTVLWTYCHPWEFDPGEKFYVYEHGGLPASIVGWTNRKGMMGRVERLLAEGVGPPLREVAAGLGELPEFRPGPVPLARPSRLGRLRRRSDAA